MTSREPGDIPAFNRAIIELLGGNEEGKGRVGSVETQHAASSGGIATIASCSATFRSRLTKMATLTCIVETQRAASLQML